MGEPWHLGSTMRYQRATVAVAKAAEARLGVLTLAELWELGLDKHVIARLVEAGFLHRLYPGVFAVGHRALSTNGRWRAATLACGPGAAISHRTAAHAWGMTSFSPSVIDVTVPGDGGRRARPGLRVRRSKASKEEHVVIRRGVPTTTPVRTLLDVSSVMPSWELESTVERALAQRLLTVAELRRALAEPLRGRKGIAQLRVVLETLHPEVHRTRSELERVGLRLIRRHGISPAPRVNATRNDHEVDLVWDDARLIVELDGWAWHNNARQQAEDLRRAAEARRAGWRVERFTWSQVTKQPGWVAGIIQAALAAAVAPQ